MKKWLVGIRELDHRGEPGQIEEFEVDAEDEDEAIRECTYHIGECGYSVAYVQLADPDND